MVQGLGQREPGCGVMRDVPAERAMGYAAKWSAEHDNAEPPVSAEPTDEALAACFVRCVRPAKPNEYDAIRAAIPAYL